jgi:hypothetical protein
MKALALPRKFSDYCVILSDRRERRIPSRRVAEGRSKDFIEKP